jgi:paraquat-inducible protein B
MSKQPNKTLIGAFLVGAVVLLVAGALIFGGGKFFTKVSNYVMYFDGSVKGLNIGAPVIFRGVKIGSVTDVKVSLEGKDLSKGLRVPVLIEIEADRISLSGADPELQAFVSKEIAKRTGKVMELLIKSGLRAQLVSQSLVTGQLAVSFDFYPDKPIKLVGGDTEHMEIPTIPSTMEALTETIKDLPLEELVDRILKLVKNADSVVNSPDLKGSISALHEALKSANKLVQNVDGKVGPLISSIDKTAVAAQAALKEAKESLDLTENVLAEDSPALTELTNALRDISAAARSLSALTDYLQRHPESLLRGKGGPQ